MTDSNWSKDHQQVCRSGNQMYLEHRWNPPHKQSACLCLVPPVPSPANQRTARRPEPGTSTASGWDLVWPMSACPITRFCSACLVPPPTPSRTGRVTSVSCPTGSHVTSGEWATCQSSSSPTQPTPPSGVCRYCTAAETATAAACRHFFSERLLNPPGCCSLPSHILPLRVFLTSDFSSPQPPATDGSTVKVMAGGSGFKCYCLAEHISGHWPILLLFLSAGQGTHEDIVQIWFLLILLFVCKLFLKPPGLYSLICEQLTAVPKLDMSPNSAFVILLLLHLVESLNQLFFSAK